MKNSILNLTDDPQDIDQVDQPTVPAKAAAASKAVAVKPVPVKAVPVVSEPEETGSAPAETKVPITDLEKEARHRERYLKHIKRFIDADGETKAPRRLEPNKV